MKICLQQASYIIVDDDEDDRYLLRLAIQQLGYPIVIKEFSNGQELLDYLAGDAIGKDPGGVHWLIVLDSNMPVLDGRQTLLKLRQNPHWQHVPVLALATSEDPRQMSELMEAGATAYHAKPYTFNAYKQLIFSTFSPWLLQQPTTNRLI